MSPLVDEPAISLLVREHEEPGIEVRVNFGVFAGRHATPAEIEELALALRESLTSFAIVSEERHEFGESVEAAVHQVVVEVPQELAGEEPGAPRRTDRPRRQRLGTRVHRRPERAGRLASRSSM